MSLAIASNSEDLDEPLLFVLPPSQTARSWDTPEHPNGAKGLSRVGLVPRDGAPSQELTAFYGLGLITVDHGSEPLLRIEFDALQKGRNLDLRPALPLSLGW